MNKKILLLAFIVLLTHIAIASHVTFPDRTGESAIDYNTDDGFTIICDPNTGESCPDKHDHIEVDLCGKISDVEGDRPEIRDFDGDGDDEYLYFTGFDIPRNAKCDIGVNNYAFELLSDGNFVESGGTLELDVATETDNLLARLNVGGALFGGGSGDGILSDFRMTNAENALQGEIVVSEWDKGGDHDRATKTAKLNFVLDTDTPYLNSFLENPYPIDCPKNDPSYEEDDNDNCQVSMTEFTYNHNEVGVSKCSNGIGCRSGYSSGDVYYKTNGEIVVGQEYGKDGAGGPPDRVRETKFHLCHSAVDSTQGNTVYSPGDNYGNDQFRCNYQGEWEAVALCEDGVDNDGNGATDLNDAKCDSSWKNSEVEPATCNPRIGELAADYEDPDTGKTYEKGRKVAFYSPGDNFVDDTSNCGYDNFDPEVDYSGEPPELFRCTSSGGYSSYSSTDSEDNGNAVTSDTYLTYLCDELADIVSDETWNAHSGSMPVVEYFIARDDIPIGFNKYATDGGFQNKFYESLHSVEEDHYRSVEVSCDNEPNNVGPTGVACYTTEHNNDSYEPIDIVDLGDGYESGDFLDSWMIANATGDSTDKIYSGWGEIDRDEVFSGGFAGKCDTGLKWRFDQNDEKWRCSGQLNWGHRYLVPDLPPGSNGDETVGVFIRNKTFNPGLTYQNLETVWKNEQNEDLDVNYMDVMCFAGTSYSDDLSSDKQFSKQLEVPEEVNKAFFKVTGTIDMSDHDNYTCRWQFNATTENGFEKIFDDEGRVPQPVSEEKLVDLGVDEGSNANPGDLDSVSETSTTEIESSYS